MKNAITIVRAMYIAGRHLNQCFADAGHRAAGWKQMQDARRICRRLGWKPEGVLP